MSESLFDPSNGGKQRERGAQLMLGKVSNSDTFCVDQLAGRSIMSGSKLILRGIRELLRARGMTYRDLAAQLGVSEPTVKRDLSRGNFSLGRLDRICEVLGVGMEELIRGDGQGPVLLTELSDVQEQELIADARLLLITYLVLNDWKFAEIIAAFHIDENELVSLLLRLDAMRLVDYRPPNRIRKLTARNFSWRKDGSVHRFFIEHILPEFFAARFDAPTDGFHFMGGSLSDGSMRYIAAEMSRLAREFDALARQDAALPLEARSGCSAVFALRSWEYSAFTRLRRATNPSQSR
ncbi:MULTISPECIES: helix-turn-helix domain-containing protein [Stenotrophomonas]|uniref:helix-turn-helix domain-containing protein n=1 Tax=Stenotrophomonas TaxID=40323 RepID=UPI001CE0E8AF|nr:MULTISPECIES: helix-turn-helix transcriptional regulator [Stenotrophomonas]